jgi:hypothetical protein
MKTNSFPALWILLLTSFSLLACESQSGKPSKLLATDSIRDTAPPVISPLKEGKEMLVRIDSVTRSYCQLRPDVVRETIGISFEGEYLELVSDYLNDSTADDASNYFRPVPLAQALRFYYGGKLERVVPHPVKKKRLPTVSSGKVWALDNGIYQVKILKGKDNWGIEVEGSGGCISCSEFNAFYSGKGMNLGIHYGTKYEVFRSDMKSSSVAEFLGVDWEMIHSDRFPVVRSAPEWHNLKNQVDCNRHPTSPPK